MINYYTLFQHTIFTTRKKHLKRFLDERVGLYIKSGVTANDQRILLTFYYHSHESSRLWCWHHSAQQELSNKRAIMIITDTKYQHNFTNCPYLQNEYIHVCVSMHVSKLTKCILIKIYHKSVNSLSVICLRWYGDTSILWQKKTIKSSVIL